jgi:Tfp pilus assembly protein PilO
MKGYFARLSSLERRFVFGVLFIVFLVLNAWLVWPHFSDWKTLNNRTDKARTLLAKFQKTIADSASVEKKVREMEGEGLAVPLEDASVEFVRTIQSQAALSGVTMGPSGSQPSVTNQFFVEKKYGLTATAGEAQLVDFLYNLGAGSSLIRVRSLTMRPDAPHHALNGNLTLVASYQKKQPAPAVKPAPAAPAATTKSAPAPAAAAPTTKSVPAHVPTNKPASSVPAPPKSATPTKK